MSGPEEDARQLLMRISDLRRKAHGADMIRTQIRLNERGEWQQQRRILFKRGPWERVVDLSRPETDALYDALGIIEREATEQANKLAARLEVKR